MVVTVVAVVFSFLAKFALFRWIGRSFLYLLITLYNLFIIVILSIGIGFFATVLIFIASTYEFFISDNGLSVSATNLGLIFTLIVTSLFVFGTMILALFPLSKKKFTIAFLSIIVIGTMIIFPLIVKHFYPSVTISFLFAFLLSLVICLIAYLFMHYLNIMDSIEYRKIKNDRTLTMREKRQKLERFKWQTEQKREKNKRIQPAVFPWIYYRRKPETE